MFICGLAQYEEYLKAAGPSDTSYYYIFFFCMLYLNSVETGIETDRKYNIQVSSHESDARDYLEQATEICLYGKVSKHTFWILRFKKTYKKIISKTDLLITKLSLKNLISNSKKIVILFSGALGEILEYLEWFNFITEK